MNRTTLRHWCRLLVLLVVVGALGLAPARVRAADPAWPRAGGTRNAGYRMVCQDSAGAPADCDSPGAHPLHHPSDPARGALIETWTRAGGVSTHIYYWSGSLEFRDFQTFADRVAQLEAGLTRTAGLFAIAAGVSVGGCVTVYTPEGGLLCTVGGIGALGAAAFFFYLAQDWERQTSGARLQQRLYPGERLPGTSFQPHTAPAG